ncbi:MAG: ParB/RepB/Spo0J family partition protein [Erysipelotrichaceae bacterium]|nr:ParB/RepB/Spo0J family partition protein [Erysipelotrichaceae bacterium]
MSRKTINDIKIPTYDDLFTTEEMRQEEKLEKIRDIPLSDITEFKNHPFKVRMDDDMVNLVESISEYGVLNPTLVRPNPNGDGYEMISGHRRMKACELTNLETIPCIIRDLTDDEATIIMVDANIQREKILPTERGMAYKLKLEAMKHQGKRTDLTSAQLGPKLRRTNQQLAQEVGDSVNQVKRFIRLTELIEPLKNMVDGISEYGKKIAFSPAVELSFLSKEEQEMVVKYIDELDFTPSHAQTIRMKTLSKEGRLDENVIYSIMSEVKPNQREKLTFMMDDINDYFPKGYTPKQKSDLIISLLSKWAKSKKKEQSR